MARERKKWNAPGYHVILRYYGRGKKCSSSRSSTGPPEEPELIKQIREAGINPLAQESYFIIMPEQQTLGPPRTIDMMIGNLETGIEYLRKHHCAAHLLRERLNELMKEHPSYFTRSNGMPKYAGDNHKSDFNSARNCMNS